MIKESRDIRSRRTSQTGALSIRTKFQKLRMVRKFPEEVPRKSEKCSILEMNIQSKISIILGSKSNGTETSGMALFS